MSPHQCCDHRHQRIWGGVLGALLDFRIQGKTTSPALECISPDNFLDHPNAETLLEPAELAVVSPSLVHRAVLVCLTHILGVPLDSSLEEALAALAGLHAVVLPWCLVPAHGAQMQW